MTIEGSFAINSGSALNTSTHEKGFLAWLVDDADSNPKACRPAGWGLLRGSKEPTPRQDDDLHPGTPECHLSYNLVWEITNDPW